jgi:hypothetical protein
LDEPGKRSLRDDGALAGVGAVLLVVVPLAARMVWRSRDPVASLYELGFLGLVSLIGIAVGWRRLRKARLESRNRPKPLDLG